MLIFGYAIYGTYVSPNFRDRFNDTKEDEYRIEFCSNKIKGEKTKMKLQDKIEKLIKNGWSYGKLAKELGVSKTTISRWHKGENKPSYPYYEEQLDYLLRQPVRKDCQIDNQKDAETHIEKYFNDMKERKLGKECKIVVIDDMTFSVDEQIEWLEKSLAELKAQKEKDKWQFTEDEKVILRNLPEKYTWIARDNNGGLFVFTTKPNKREPETGLWRIETSVEYFYSLSAFEYLFQCIQWSDTEPCEFRKYI